MTVRLADVSFTWPGSAAPALDGLDLEAAPGRVTWLFGPLGAGASTALLVAGGLAPAVTGGPRSGTVEVLGHDPATTEGRAALAGRLGYVSAQPHLQLSGLADTVFDEVAFAPANLGWPRERIFPAVEAALARLGVDHLRDRPPGELSGGELQRVVLAAMLVLAPDVWLLDEPASALDPAARRMAWALFRAEADRGATVVVASEDADQLLPVADTMVLLAGGRTVRTGSPAELLASDETWALGAGSTAVAELWRAALAADPGLARDGPIPLTADQAVARLGGAR